jgi:hypothetical protein
LLSCGFGLRKVEANFKMGTELYGPNSQNGLNGRNWRKNGKNLILTKNL